MSNVLYTCSGTKDPEHPEETDCGSRVFAAPGGTKLKCRHHPEATYVQREDAPGNLFTYTEERNKGAGQGEPSSRVGGGKALGDVTAKAVATIEPKVVAAGNQDFDKETHQIITVVDPDDLPTDLRGLRQAYELVFGDRPDLRLRETKLTMLIQDRMEKDAEKELEAKELALASSAEVEVELDDPEPDTEDEDGEEE